MDVDMDKTLSYNRRIIMTTKQQFIREVLEITKRRMMSRVANTTALSVITNSSVSLSTELTTNANLPEIVLGVGYILLIVTFLVKILLRTIRKFEYHYMSPSYNRFGFMMNEESESESESDTDFDSDVSDVESSSSSPISLRPILSGKYLRLQTPVQTMNAAVTPKTPAPLRRSLRLKIKSELNLCAMQNNSAMMITRSQSRQIQNIVISSDPCPYNRGSITTPSPHPEHDEERAYYIRYCNDKKMTKKRPEFNSPIFVRRLVL
jgi:hypothetical protein